MAIDQVFLGTYQRERFQMQKLSFYDLCILIYFNIYEILETSSLLMILQYSSIFSVKLKKTRDKSRFFFFSYTECFATRPTNFEETMMHKPLP